MTRTAPAPAKTSCAIWSASAIVRAPRCAGDSASAAMATPHCTEDSCRPIT